jgi:uncharacterized membrane-anchored protein YjiN (DUF445 family)
VRQWSGSLWTNMKNSVLAAAADPNSELRARVTGMIRDLARMLQTDPTVRELVQRHTHTVAGYLVERFAGDIADLVGSTVERWDTEETSRRIELQVGRDLQWIRVNGTVVGGLAGLAIYTIAQLLS